MTYLTNNSQLMQHLSIHGTFQYVNKIFKTKPLSEAGATMIGRPVVPLAQSQYRVQVCDIV